MESIDAATLVSENWHQERDRLVHLLAAIRSGDVTHIEEADARQLQATNPQNIGMIEERLAQLNARLGEDED